MNPESITPTLQATSSNVLANNDYSVEFFHIYTDEQIGAVHEASLQYLQQAKKAWDFNYTLMLLVDDYNPKEHTLKAGDVLTYLDSKGVLPDFWAYEGALVENANLLLKSLTSAKLKKSYVRYIEQHGKYPCSLLTAAWYLTRLGVLPSSAVIRPTSDKSYLPAKRLINILPQDYKHVELRAQELIRHSEFTDCVDRIQDLFFPMSSGREISLW